MPTYAYSDYRDAVRGRMHNMQGILANERITLNNAVRETLEIDFRSSKRKAAAAPNLFDEIYQYACPADLKTEKVIGLQPQTQDRSRFAQFELVGEEEFDVYKQSKDNLIAFSDRDIVRKFLASVDVNERATIISTLDTTSGDGTWQAVGDAINILADSYNYIKGTGSIMYDINGGNTTAGIEALDIPVFDLTQFYTFGSVFVWAYIVDPANITDFRIRLGNNATNYFEIIATATNEGTAFAAGWNLLRFDFNLRQQTGTVSLTTCVFGAVFMTKNGSKTGTSYRFDHIILKLGQIYNFIYYSKYLWQDNTGAWKENSTADDDKLNLDTEEFNLAVEKGCEHFAMSILAYAADAGIARARYQVMKMQYLKSYRSEALQQVSNYYNF